MSLVVVGYLTTEWVERTAEEAKDTSAAEDPLDGWPASDGRTTKVVRVPELALLEERLDFVDGDLGREAGAS